MKKFLVALTLTSLLCMPAFAAPLSSNARTVIPSAIQQILSVDYRALRGSQTALALKNRVLPQNLKQFETALRTFGIDPSKDVEQITFVTYRGSDKSLNAIGIAQGPFKQKEFLQKMRLKGIKPESLASNTAINDLITDSDSAPIWSVLDQLGTQNMMKSALGQASSLGDYDVVKKRLLASDYVMNFDNGVTFDLSVKTSDNMTAASLASLLKAGVMYRKINATPDEKMALDGMSVDNQHDLLKMTFKTDDDRFQALLKSELFASVSH